ncbi:hypothetical protein HispidOSU_000908 [Sigmodon hispidus]
MRPEADEFLGGAGLHPPDWVSVLERTKVKTDVLLLPVPRQHPRRRLVEICRDLLSLGSHPQIVHCLLQQCSEE